MQMNSVTSDKNYVCLNHVPIPMAFCIALEYYKCSFYYSDGG